MKTKTDTADDIMNELTDIDYDDDDSLTLLDDEEIQPISQQNVVEEDADLAAFYIDYPESNETEISFIEDAEELKLTEPVVEEPEPAPVKGKKQVEEAIEPIVEPEPTSTKGKKTAKIDDYLSGSLDVKEEEPPSVVAEEPLPVDVAVEEVPVMVAEAPPKLEAVQPMEFPVERTDINELDQLFNKVTSNVKGATDRVNRHVDIKNKIDEKILELQKLQDIHEQNKQRDYAEINAYKDEVYAKLKAKKTEVEAQMLTLKQTQDSFEMEKQSIMDSFVRKEKELQDAYAERVKGLEQIEFGLVKRKEQLDIERFEIAKEREKCEYDKKELADNLLKFNNLVDDFTKGVDRFSDNN